MTWDWQPILEHCPSVVMTTAAGTVGCRYAGVGPEILLLHGIGSASGSWAYQLAGLGGHFRVIAWDAPGYGASAALTLEWPTAGDYARALAALHDACALDRCIVVGHSFGALIAARFAADHPTRVRGVILVDPALGNARLAEADRQRRLHERVGRFLALGAEAYAEKRAPRLLSKDALPEHLALVRDGMSRLNAEGYRKAARMLAYSDIFREVAHIDAPATVIFGAEDNVTPPAECRSVAQAFPDAAACHELAGAGHVAYVEAADRFNALVSDLANHRL